MNYLSKGTHSQQCTTYLPCLYSIDNLFSLPIINQNQFSLCLYLQIRQSVFSYTFWSLSSDVNCLIQPRCYSTPSKFIVCLLVLFMFYPLSHSSPVIILFRLSTFHIKFRPQELQDYKNIHFFSIVFIYFFTFKTLISFCFYS